MHKVLNSSECFCLSLLIMLQFDDAHFFSLKFFDVGMLEFAALELSPPWIDVWVYIYISLLCKLKYINLLCCHLTLYYNSRKLQAFWFCSTNFHAYNLWNRLSPHIWWMKIVFWFIFQLIFLKFYPPFELNGTVGSCKCSTSTQREEKRCLGYFLFFIFCCHFQQSAAVDDFIYVAFNCSTKQTMGREKYAMGYFFLCFLCVHFSNNSCWCFHMCCFVLKQSIMLYIFCISKP